MCKNCEKVKKHYKEIISAFRYQDLIARNLLSLACSYLPKDLPFDPFDNVSVSGVLLRNRIIEFLSKTYIRK